MLPEVPSEGADPTLAKQLRSAPTAGAAFVKKKPPGGDQAAEATLGSFDEEASTYGGTVSQLRRLSSVRATLTRVYPAL
jgi:hypothetical protein